jgi:hypothetical protein
MGFLRDGSLTLHHNIMNRAKIVRRTRSAGRPDATRPTGMSFDPISQQPLGSQVFFDRRELDLILRLYGRMVALGEWRDYGMDALRDAAVFSIFRRSSEAPIYRIEKRPALARRQGAFAVLGPGGVILKRGHELEQVLKVFDARRFRVVE